MPLSWNEIKSNALQFSKTWADAASEDSQAKPFWIDFFEIFGVNNKPVATFEHAVKKLLGASACTDGFVDHFWPGMLVGALSGCCRPGLIRRLRRHKSAQPATAPQLK
jgi:hypothetical protein